MSETQRVRAACDWQIVGVGSWLFPEGYWECARCGRSPSMGERMGLVTRRPLFRCVTDDDESERAVLLLTAPTRAELRRERKA